MKCRKEIGYHEKNIYLQKSLFYCKLNYFADFMTSDSARVSYYKTKGVLINEQSINYFLNVF